MILGIKIYASSETMNVRIAGPVSLTLVSVIWWDNFVPVLESWKTARRYEIRHMRKLKIKEGFMAGSVLFRAKYSIKDRRTKIDAICSVWKILLNLLIPLILLSASGGNSCVSTFFLVTDKTDSGCVLWTGGLGLANGRPHDWCKAFLPFAVAGVCILTSFAAYKAAQVSCKINAQQPCFSLPLLLTVPVTFVISLAMYRKHFSLLGCSVLWPTLGPNNTLLDLLKEYSREYWLPIIFGGILQMALTCSHVWTPSAERVASTDKLFVRPMFCGILFVQSMLFSRAVDDHETPSATKTKKANTENDNWTTRLQSMTADTDKEEEIEEQMKHARFPRIYACATMWHETAREMTQLLKSLFRMDCDQFARSCMWKRFNIVDKDFYHYEAHIFFDDAFKKINPDATSDNYTDSDFVVNDYVKQFTSVVDEASQSVYPPRVSVSPPTKIITPYGGRLTYDLPGGNPMVVHLKNKYLIRHKKRWSQVMYMYYLLSYRLLLGEGSKSSKKRLADNTFLLALDGDVDFYPDAVQLLVDRMKRSSHVGAACGRIHPIGSGLMVWYQKFEYAVSHWLQKATEHVFGCVLCSPGCFSLFRGSALMEDNVIKRYAKKATNARHAVQYDMGEDRWLCTLLLQQGKRVEYAAAADALTFCPDDFGEFFTQRRRWTPSTMANILNLLSDWRHITKVNSSISFPFIVYQTFLFVSSILTPGTIFLLIFGAINTAYPELPLYVAMLLNFAPVLVFIILCFVARSEIQIAYATILSTVYSLVMMIVLVGLLRQIQESGLCSVTAIFFLGIAVVFATTAILHPQEMGNILFGLLYFLAIPCTSMILVFYAVANLNVVSWGTRDSTTPTARGGEKKSLSERLGLGRIRRVISGKGEPEVEKKVTSDYTFSFGNLFRCICCPIEKTDDTAVRFRDIENALYDLRRAILDQKGHPSEDVERQELSLDKEPGPSVSFKVEPAPIPAIEKDADNTPGHPATDPWPESWWQEEALGMGLVEGLPPKESTFWSQLIERYLKPLEISQEEQEQMAKDLTMLRNKAAMLFFLGNALFVTIIFILESVSEYSPGLTIQLPCDQGHVGQKIEPISVVFTVVFGILLIFQFFAMLIHRLSTLVHIIASTTLQKKNTGNEAENFNQFGFFDLTYDILRNPFPEEIRPGTDASSSTPDSGVQSNDDTATEASHDHIKQLIRRQTTRGRSLKGRNLQEVFEEGVKTLILGNIGESSDDPEREGKEDKPEAEDDKDTSQQVERVKPWIRSKSIKALNAISRNKSMLETVQRRTNEAARKNWERARRSFISERAGSMPRRQRPNFANVVKQAIEHERKGGSTEGETSPVKKERTKKSVRIKTSDEPEQKRSEQTDSEEKPAEPQASPATAASPVATARVKRMDHTSKVKPFADKWKDGPTPIASRGKVKKARAPPVPPASAAGRQRREGAGADRPQPLSSPSEIVVHVADEHATEITEL
ncbi:chitin synthase chs-2-like isoform X2 [Pomacea canaliculata]|nr:chitin synthase chs-2-like isoform X2 [Pomacea canaliculata]